MLLSRLLLGAVIVSAFAGHVQAQVEGTYRAVVGSQSAAAVRTLSIESPATHRLQILEICVNTSPATATATVNSLVARTTTASSGGTLFAPEGTSNFVVSKMDPSSADFPGVARLDGTPGTAGAVLDRWNIIVPEIGAGTADPGGLWPFCRPYYQIPGGMLIPSGVTNGIQVQISAAGAGAFSGVSISVTFVTLKNPGVL
jgi:hypothetical protein